MLQQTTAAAVAKLYDSFYATFPNWQALHQAEIRDAPVFHPDTGLGPQRAKRLKQMAAWVAEHDWRLRARATHEEDIPGIGQYVAASALLAIKHGEPEPLLDVNMARAS